MAYSERLAERIRQTLGGRRDVVEKRMFGGLVFMIHGNLCVGVRKQSMIARVGADAAEDALRSPNVESFPGGGKVMKGWIEIDPDGLDLDDDLARWVELATTFVETLPAK